MNDRDFQTAISLAKNMRLDDVAAGVWQAHRAIPDHMQRHIALDTYGLKVGKRLAVYFQAATLQGRGGIEAIDLLLTSDGVTMADLVAMRDNLAALLRAPRGNSVLEMAVANNLIPNLKGAIGGMDARTFFATVQRCITGYLHG